MRNDEMDDLLRPLGKISYDLVCLIRYAVFSGIGQSYTVEQKKELLAKALNDVVFTPSKKRAAQMAEDTY
jgi:hypothetical protein